MEEDANSLASLPHDAPCRSQGRDLDVVPRLRQSPPPEQVASIPTRCSRLHCNLLAIKKRSHS